MEKKYIVNFSGGKDSTAMLFKLIELGKPINSIIFADTGLEFPEMYEHIEKVQKMIYPLKINIVRGEFSFWEKVKEYGFPHMRDRWCNTELKVQPIRKFMRERYGLHNYFMVECIGYAVGEESRAIKKASKNNRYRKYEFPLIELRMAEKDALDYCYKLGFKWGGLYEKMNRVSCWICPFQNRKSLEALKTYYPDYFQKIINLESELKKEGKVMWWQFKLHKYWKEMKKEKEGIS